MELKSIRTKRDYASALLQAEAWWDAPTGSRDAERLDVLTLLLEDYEKQHFPIELPDPIE